VPTQHEATGAIDRASIVILCVANVSHEIDGRLPLVRQMDKASLAKPLQRPRQLLNTTLSLTLVADRCRRRLLTGALQFRCAIWALTGDALDAPFLPTPW
jgi:hypothetical protein